MKNTQKWKPPAREYGIKKSFIQCDGIAWRSVSSDFEDKSAKSFHALQLQGNRATEERKAERERERERLTLRYEAP